VSLMQDLQGIQNLLLAPAEGTFIVNAFAQSIELSQLSYLLHIESSQMCRYSFLMVTYPSTNHVYCAGSLCVRV